MGVQLSAGGRRWLRRSPLILAAFGMAGGLGYAGWTHRDSLPNPFNDVSGIRAKNEGMVIQVSTESSDENDDAARLAAFKTALYQIAGGNVNGQDYTIIGGHTVQSSDGSSTYAFNFQTRIVTIDGAGEADKALSFKELENQAGIADAKEAACWGANQKRDKYPALDAYKLDAVLQEEKDRTLRNRDAFKANHCADWKP